MKRLLIFLIALGSASVSAKTLQGNYSLIEADKGAYGTSGCPEQLEVIVSDEGVMTSPYISTMNTNFDFRAEREGCHHGTYGVYAMQSEGDICTTITETSAKSRVSEVHIAHLGIAIITDYIKLDTADKDLLYLGVDSKNFPAGILGEGDDFEWQCKYQRI